MPIELYEHGKVVERKGSRKGKYKSSSKGMCNYSLLSLIYVAELFRFWALIFSISFHVCVYFKYTFDFVRVSATYTSTFDVLAIVQVEWRKWQSRCTPHSEVNKMHCLYLVVSYWPWSIKYTPRARCPHRRCRPRSITHRYRHPVSGIQLFSQSRETLPESGGCRFVGLCIVMLPCIPIDSSAFNSKFSFGVYFVYLVFSYLVPTRPR